MADLSPQAQAVVDAAVCHPAFATKKRIAAALRAAVEQCTDTDDFGDEYINPEDLLSIAHELEQHQ